MTQSNCASDVERSEGTAGNRRGHLIGLALLVASGLFWSLNGALIKLVYEDGAGPHGVTIAFYRSLFAGLFIVPLAFRRRPSPAKDGGRRGRSRLATLLAAPGTKSMLGLRPAAFCCMVFFTCMTVCFVVANTMTAAANAIILQYTSTFWIFSLSPWLLKEKPQAKELGLLTLAMIGIGIIFAGNARTDLGGLLVALGSGLFFGLLTMMIRQMRDSDSAAVTVLNNLGSALLLIPVVAIFGQFQMTPRAWLLIVTMGIVQFGLPYYLYTLGLARVPAYQAALLTLLEPVLVPIWTYLAVREVPPVQTFLGGTVILVALVAFILSASRAARTRLASTVPT